MDEIINNYIESDNKADYFSSLTPRQQIDLFIRCKNERQKIASIMTTDQIRSFLIRFPVNAPQRKCLYEQLSKNQLKQLYRAFNEELRKQLIGELEAMKRDMTSLVKDDYEAIDNYSNTILSSEQRKVEAVNNIAQANITIEKTNEKVSYNLADIKRVRKEREKYYNKKIKQMAKTPSRFKSVNNRRLEKIKELAALQEEKQEQLNALNAERTRLLGEIRAAKKTIKDENKAYSAANTTISKSRDKIDAARKEIAEANELERELTQVEKRVLSRKEYNEVVKQADAASEKEEKEEAASVEPATPAPKEEPTPVEKPETVAPAPKEEKPAPAEKPETVAPSPKEEKVGEEPIKRETIKREVFFPPETPQFKTFQQIEPIFKPEAKEEKQETIGDYTVSEYNKKILEVVEMLTDYGVSLSTAREIVSSNSPALLSNLLIKKVDSKQIAQLIYHVYATSQKTQQEIKQSSQAKAYATTLSLGEIFVFIALFMLVLVLLIS